MDQYQLVHSNDYPTAFRNGAGVANGKSGKKDKLTLEELLTALLIV